MAQGYVPSDRLAGFCIPDPRRLVIRRGDNARAVRAEARRVNLGVMAQQFAHPLAGFRVPDPRRPVIRRGDNARAVRAEAGRVNLASWRSGSPTRWPVFASQIRAVLSFDAVTMRVPSALKLAA